MTRFLREDIFEVMKAPTGDLDINFLVAYARPIISQLLEENRILREGLDKIYNEIYGPKVDGWEILKSIVALYHETLRKADSVGKEKG